MGRKVVDLEKKCTSMAHEMERKDKGKATMVDRLLMGTSTPFTRRVADYHLGEKFKVSQIQSYTRVGDLVDHFEKKKKDPKFRRPSKILGNPAPYHKNKYCNFHEAADHHTEGCIALRLLIEKFIKNRKLV